ncbi:MAG TPA: ATP-binding protein [Xanthomonadales bacterium]|nr:ATP-binding protein [Xanthomonadales bacterium]
MSVPETQRSATGEGDRAEACLDRLPHALALLDRAGVLIFTNRAWRRLLGPPGFEAMRRRDLEYAAWLAERAADAESGELAAQRIRAAVRGAGSTQAEIQLSLDGETHWLALYAAALPDGGALVMHEDLAALKQLEQHRARFINLADRSRDYIVLFEPAGRISYLNDAAKRLAERIGASQGGWLEPDLARWPNRLIGEAGWRNALAHGEWHGELSFIAPDGDIATRCAVIAHRDEDGVMRYLSAVLHDLSDEKRREDELQNRNVELEFAYARLKGAQEQLLQSEKMASIGQLAAGVAHEINNPIGFVHSNLGTLREYIINLFALVEGYERALGAAGASPALRGEIDDLKRRFDFEFVLHDLPALLSESRSGIERVKKIVQDLKDFSYAGSGEHWQLADLHKGLDSTLNIVRNEIKYKAEIVKDYGALPMVECLPMQLNQVFMNMLVNAGHSIRERGTIRITTRAAGGEVEVAFTDSGEGIPAHVLPRIFDPFFTTKQVGQGTGLGLSLSYGIVQKHHGRIEVESKEGVGTTFTVVLPVQQPPQEPR